MIVRQNGDWAQWDSQTRIYRAQVAGITFTAGSVSQLGAVSGLTFTISEAESLGAEMGAADAAGSGPLTVTKAGLQSRFTQAEFDGIDRAQTNTGLPDQVRLAVKFLWNKAQRAEDVDPTSDEVLAGAQLLHAYVAECNAPDFVARITAPA